MKKTQFINALRNIRKNFISWFAVSIVTMIGCGVFCGIFFYQDAMIEASDDFFKKTSFEDMEILVPEGVSEEDIEGLKEVDGVSDAEGSYKLNGVLTAGKGKKKIYTEIRMLSERISLPLILEGTLPEGADECAMSTDAMDRYGIRVGDTVKMGSVYNIPKGFIRNKEFVVTARVQHPIAFRQNQLVLMLLPEEAYETGMLGGRFTYVYVDADISGDIGLLDEEYFNAVIPVRDRIREYFAGKLDSGILIITRAEMNGYVLFKTIMTILKKLATIFVVLFFVIGIIVVFSTITIIISGQKKLIGAMRAIGFRKWEIAAGYILFGGTAVIFGMLLSVVLEIMLQLVMFREFGSMFIVSPEKMPFHAGIFIGLSLLETVMACIVALFATIKSALSVSAVELMTGNTKSMSTKATASEKGRLYSRLIFRNMRTDLARVLVTVVIIAGCTLMMGAGFTLNGALNNMMIRSAAEITHYDIEVSGAGDMLNDLENELADRGISYGKVTKTGTYIKAGNSESNATVMSGEQNIYPDYIELTDMKRQNRLSPPDSGVFISNRIAEKNSLNVGDEIQIFDSSYSVHNYTVDGIIRNYYGAVIVVSPETYAEIFGREPTENILMICADDSPSLIEEWKDEYPGLTCTLTDEMPDNFKGVTRIFTVMVIIMTGLSIMMSVFVLLNIVNIFVSRRQDELIVMRVNGFSHNEVIGYLLQETVVTSVTGIVLSIISGCALTEFVVRIVEPVNAMFVRDISPVAWLFASMLEGIFALIINLFAFRKVKMLQLTDITK